MNDLRHTQEYFVQINCISFPEATLMISCADVESLRWSKSLTMRGSKLQKATLMG